jgi:hypothetical protein
MTWQIATAANLGIAAAYLAISTIIFRGLVQTGQLSRNRLGLATGLIFFTCGIGHGVHGVHMLLPLLGIADGQALALRESWHWETAAWDVFSLGVGMYYLSLRGSYASVLRGAQMFEDLKARERQAVEINDNIVQGLTVAKYAMESGRDEQSRRAVSEALRNAQDIISGLLIEADHGSIEPGRLRRDTPAHVSRAAVGGP